jgi:cysteine desulfuration protein SufE
MPGPMAATPAANEQVLLESFLPLTDPQERLALIVEACAGAGLPETSRAVTDLVPGCVSRVWLRGSCRSGQLQLEWDAESPLVRGLAGLICRIYQGVPAEAAVGFCSRILTGLGLDRQLSPTRLRGLAAVERRIHQLASS